MERSSIKDSDSLILHGDISQYPWGGTYRPKSETWLFYREGSGFLVRMRCLEADIRAVNTLPDSPVYEDSCLECFLNFYPDLSPKYLNFEVNARGVMRCQVGTGREDRVFIRSLGLSQPQVLIKQGPDFWEISYLIPISLIQAVYGRSSFAPGHTLRGNFYKCGDKTPQPHFGCLKGIRSEEPNFHLPQYFGSFSVGRATQREALSDSSDSSDSSD